PRTVPRSGSGPSPRTFRGGFAPLPSTLPPPAPRADVDQVARDVLRRPPARTLQSPTAPLPPAGPPRGVAADAGHVVTMGGQLAGRGSATTEDRATRITCRVDSEARHPGRRRPRPGDQQRHRRRHHPRPPARGGGARDP